MNTENIFYTLRTNSGLSQDELAKKVFVTRQAVSRWETGETVPNTETLKLLSELFDVSINTLLGVPQKRICQCCGMPLEEEIVGRNKDGTPNEDYCKWCYADGTYTYSDMDDLLEVCVSHMASEAFPEEQARAYMKQLLPQLDYWKKYKELGDNGRVLLRKSGTEPLLRVMSEATTKELCEEKVDNIIAAMQAAGKLIRVK